MNFYNFNIFKKSVKFNATTYAYGVKEENRLLIPLQQFFNDDTLRPMPDGSKFDFMGKGKYIELKSRTFCKDKYDTTCISVCKIEYAKRNCHNYDFYFVFNFTDGVWWYKYDKDKQLFTSNIFGVTHYFIPISYLKPMNIENNDTTIHSKTNILLSPA